jgi:hypothetical protein
MLIFSARAAENQRVDDPKSSGTKKDQLAMSMQIHEIKQFRVNSIFSISISCNWHASCKVFYRQTL